MKIRTSFVTNSSSSSFIVMFEELPEDQNALKKMLFGDEETHSKYDYSFPTELIAEQVWKDMVEIIPPYLDSEGKEIIGEYVNHKTIDIFDVARELQHADGAPELYNYQTDEEFGGRWLSSNDTYNPKYVKGKTVMTREDGSTWDYDDIDWALLQKDEREWAYAKAEELLSKYPEDHFFKFSYADEDGRLGCVMEHGGIFDKLGEDKVIRISHH